MLILIINWTIALYGAFMALILLIVLLIVISKMVSEKKAKKAIEKPVEPVQEGISGAESAAIAMALHLYYGVHDEESDVITIKNIQNSPWNSKIYGIQ